MLWLKVLRRVGAQARGKIIDELVILYNTHGVNVTATAARQNFAALLERALAGEEIAIERHGRIVARLVPAHAARQHLLPAQDQPVAEVRGVAAESPLSRIFRDRALKRLAIAGARVDAALEKLAQHGVRARLIGSMARGSFRATSDVDILVQDPGSLDERAIERIVRAEMGDFPFDVVFEHKLPHELRKHFSA